MSLDGKTLCVLPRFTFNLGVINFTLDIGVCVSDVNGFSGMNVFLALCEVQVEVGVVDFDCGGGGCLQIALTLLRD